MEFLTLEDKAKKREKFVSEVENRLTKAEFDKMMAELQFQRNSWTAIKKGTKRILFKHLAVIKKHTGLSFAQMAEMNAAADVPARIIIEAINEEQNGEAKE